MHSHVSTTPFPEGRQLVSVICTYLPLSLNLEKTQVLALEMCYGFTISKMCNGSLITVNSSSK